jgi:signal transduction histidine kinase
LFFWLWLAIAKLNYKLKHNDHINIHNLSSLLQGVEVVQPLADAAKINLDWTPLTVWVWAAPDAIVQTLMNLASNAIKFSPANSTVGKSRGCRSEGSGE